MLCMLSLALQVNANTPDNVDISNKSFTAGYYRLDEEAIYTEFTFTLTLVFPVKYTSKNQLIPPKDFPGPDLHIVEDAIVRIGYEQNTTTIEYHYLLKPKRSGIITINSFVLETQNAYSKIDPFHIEVQSIHEATDSAPQLIWVNIPDQVYQGETFQAELILINANEQWMVTSISEVQTDNLIAEKSISSEPIIEHPRAPIIHLGTWNFFASTTGIAKIDSVYIFCNNIYFTSKEALVNVLALPKIDQPNNFNTNSIGKFSVNLLYDPPDQENTIHVRVQLSGEGALHLTDLPKMHFEGMQLIKKENVHLFKPHQSGFSGVKEESYTLLITNYQEALLRLDPFNWFDPKTKNYHHENEQIITFINTKAPFKPYFHIEVLPMHETLGFNGDLYLAPYALAVTIWIIIAIFFTLRNKRNKQKSLKFFTFNLPLIYIILFLRPYWPTPSTSSLIYASELLKQQQWEQAIEALEIASNETAYQNMQGIIFYNMAVAHHYLENFPEKRFYLLKAVFFAPLSTEFVTALQQEGLGSVVRGRTLEHRIFIMIYWFTWISLLVLWLKIKIQPLTRLKSIIYLLVINIVLLTSLFALHRPQPAIAVIKENTMAMRIPDTRATYGENLTAGEVLRIVDKGVDYVQVSNYEGKEGWVQEKFIWIVKR